MTSSSEQPPYEMMDAYILTKEDWLKLREHLTIGCTNQKAFLDTLRPHPAPSTVVEDITFEGAAIVQAARKEAARKAREDFEKEQKHKCKICLDATILETRERLLNKLLTLIDSKNCPFTHDKHCPEELDCEHCCIESLRTTTPQSEQEQPR